MGSIISGKSTPYPPGIHVPSLTWFHGTEDQDIDWATQEMHLEFLVESGVDGIVIAGTNGEAAALDLDEKLQILRQTRSVCRRYGKPDLPLTVGCNGGCTRAVVAEIIAVSNAGGDFALVLVPSYFHFAMTSEAIIAFFHEIADKSSIPIVIYNFPAVVAGLDVSSEMLQVLGAHANIASVKLTCGGIAKVARIAAEFGKSRPNNAPRFTAFAGQSDWLVPALSVGGAGCITGVANLYPKSCLTIYNLYKANKLEEAEQLQLKLAQAEVAFSVGGINGTKWVVAKCRDYPESSSNCRRPYPEFSDTERRSWMLSKISPLRDIEANVS